MHRTGVNLASIVATSAVVTAVIGLSLQSTLGSVIGGVALQVDDSLNEGDWIELENGKQGQVKKVRWRHTVIETRDWDTLLVPNNQLLTQTIKILGKRHGQPVQHRMWVYFHVDFRTPPSDVISVVTKALAAPLPGVADEPKPNTVCLDLARDHKESYALYATRYWLTDLAKDDPTSSLVRERVVAALKRADIPLAIPAATLFVSNDDVERTTRKQQEALTRVTRALSHVELFRALSHEELEQLASAIRVAPFAAGEVVTRQGAKANWLYVLSEGRVDVCVATATGEMQKVNSLTAPAYFGEMALMTGAPREATVVATGDIECLRVGQNAFRRLLESRPEIASEVASVLAERRIELEAVKEHLDAGARSRRMEGERHRILAAVQDFFALKG
jgi:CRP-like cAMP-binding protein